MSKEPAYRRQVLHPLPNKKNSFFLPFDRRSYAEVIPLKDKLAGQR
ncbi:MAG: hypothetical protein RIC06_24435 [Cyclobacteriaceae bacterium]